MKTILRAYVGSVCHKEPDAIMKVLSKLTNSVDLDVADENGHVTMTETKDIVGETVKVGEYDFTVPAH